MIALRKPLIDILKKRSKDNSWKYEIEPLSDIVITPDLKYQYNGKITITNGERPRGSRRPVIRVKCLIYYTKEMPLGGYLDMTGAPVFAFQYMQKFKYTRAKTWKYFFI